MQKLPQMCYLFLDLTLFLYDLVCPEGVDHFFIYYFAEFFDLLLIFKKRLLIKFFNGTTGDNIKEDKE
jgi:hypothetical protein